MWTESWPLLWKKLFDLLRAKKINISVGKTLPPFILNGRLLRDINLSIWIESTWKGLTNNNFWIARTNANRGYLCICCRNYINKSQLTYQFNMYIIEDYNFCMLTVLLNVFLMLKYESINDFWSINNQFRSV